MLIGTDRSTLVFGTGGACQVTERARAVREALRALQQTLRALAPEHPGPCRCKAGIRNFALRLELAAFESNVLDRMEARSLDPCDRLLDPSALAASHDAAGSSDCQRGDSV